jgi:cobalamin synthase
LTYLPLTAGAVIGAAGSLIFIVRSPALAREGRRRKLAVRLVLITYVAIACLVLVIAIALGNLEFIAISGALAILAIAGLVFTWVGERFGGRSRTTNVE